MKKIYKKPEVEVLEMLGMNSICQASIHKDGIFFDGMPSGTADEYKDKGEGVEGDEGWGLWAN